MDIRGTCGILQFYYEHYFFFPFPYLVLIILLILFKAWLYYFLNNWIFNIISEVKLVPNLKPKDNMGFSVDWLLSCDLGWESYRQQSCLW